MFVDQVFNVVHVCAWFCFADRYGTENHTLIGGNGEVFHNGKRVKKKQRVTLNVYDRVVLGGEASALAN